MARVASDRVCETSTTTGTGAFTLAGALIGFRAFSSVCSTNDTCYYIIEGIDSAGSQTGEWECGLGTYSGANTLTRTTVQSSSNSGSAVNFSAGTKIVSIGITASATAAFNSRNFSPPVASAFSTVASNTVQPVVTDTDFGASIDFGLFASNPIGKLAYVAVPSPSASWICDIVVQPSVYAYDMRMGVAFYESSTNKAFAFGWENSTSQPSMKEWHAASYSNAAVNLGTNTTAVTFASALPQINGFRLQYDLSSDRYYFYMAVQGGVYIPKALQTTTGLNQTRTSQFTTRADSVGVWARNGVNSATDWNVVANIPYLKFS